MKKIFNKLEILVFLVICTTLNAQTIYNKNKTTIWQTDFEESEALYVFGYDETEYYWAVSDTTPDYGYTHSSYPDGVSPLWLYMGENYVSEWSPSGNNFAFIDGVSIILGLTNTDMDPVSSWIQFNSINLTDVFNPHLFFYQNYKAFNSDSCQVCLSSDGGITWHEIEVNGELDPNDYGQQHIEIDISQYVSNSPSVSIRFKWKGEKFNPNKTETGFGYGWQIDDISIKDVQANDLEMSDARISFFEYYNYHHPDSIEMFHKSSHYTMIPQSQFSGDNASLYFHGIITNKGSEDNICEMVVEILDPELNQIYLEGAAGTTLSTLETDTLDIISGFRFENTPDTGLYTIIFKSICENDNNSSNNTDTIYLMITDKFFARDAGNFEETSSLMFPTIGNSRNAMISTEYTFTQDTYLEDICVFIYDAAINDEFEIHLLKYDNELDQWRDAYISREVTITNENMINNWICVDNPIPFLIDIDYSPIKFKIGIKFTSDNNYIRIGEDYSVPAKDKGIDWIKVVEGEYHPEFFDSYENKKCGLGIRLITDINPNINFDITECGGPAILNAPSGYETYVWSTGETVQTISVNYSGTYSYIATDEYNETISDTLRVKIYPEYIINEGFYTLCEGDTLSWHEFEITDAGEYTKTYQTITGCDSTFVINVMVAPKPIVPILTKIPASGILSGGQLGEFIISSSQSEVLYEIYKGGIPEYSIFGNGNEMSLGNSYTSGNYRITCKNDYCTEEIGLNEYDHLSFTSSSNSPKIVALISFEGFNPNTQDLHTYIKLYREQIAGQLSSVVFTAESFLFYEGQVEFTNLEPGNYYISSIIDTVFSINEGQEFAQTVFYNSALTFEEATSIGVPEGGIIFTKIQHPLLDEVVGNNTIYGSVTTENEELETMAISNAFVILYDNNTGEILRTTFTDSTGLYTFPTVPENSSIKVFVSSLEFQDWTPALIQTETETDYEINFKVDANSVFPENNNIEDPSKVSNINFTVFPNPALNEINLLNIPQNSNIYLIDNLGKSTKLLVTSNYTANISDLSPGTYYILVATKTNNFGIAKFIKE